MLEASLIGWIVSIFDNFVQIDLLTSRTTLISLTLIFFVFNQIYITQVLCCILFQCKANAYGISFVVSSQKSEYIDISKIKYKCDVCKHIEIKLFSLSDCGNYINKVCGFLTCVYFFYMSKQ